MRRRVSLALGALVILSSALVVRGQNLGGDLESLARKMVEAGAVREGDLVRVSGSPRDISLLEDLAVEVRRVGAHPLVSLETDRMARQLFEKVPARYDAQAPDFALKLAGIVTVEILVESGEDPALLASVPAPRRAAVARSFQPVGQTTLKRNVRQVFVGNGLYPAKATAEAFGMTPDALAKVFWAGIDVDYAKLRATGEAARAVLAGGREVRVTHPNGTDVRFRIEGRPVLVSDGSISADEIRKGGAACQVWLPAGEVYVTPVAGTAEGKVVMDSYRFEGKKIPGLTLTFQAGRLTGMSAQSGLEPLKAVYDAAGAGKDALGVLDLGINPNVTVPAGSRLRNWIPAGTVTLAVGDNTWAGGDNVAGFGLPAHLTGTTVTVDGKTIVEAGALKL